MQLMCDVVRYTAVPTAMKTSTFEISVISLYQVRIAYVFMLRFSLKSLKSS